MPIDVGEEHGEGRGVDDTETVSLSGLEGDGRVLVEGNVVVRGKVSGVLGDVKDGVFCKNKCERQDEKWESQARGESAPGTLKGEESESVLNATHDR